MCRKNGQGNQKSESKLFFGYTKKLQNEIPSKMIFYHTIFSFDKTMTYLTIKLTLRPALPHGTILPALTLPTAVRPQPQAAWPARHGPLPYLGSLCEARPEKGSEQPGQEGPSVRLLPSAPDPPQSALQGSCSRETQGLRGAGVESQVQPPPPREDPRAHPEDQPRSGRGLQEPGLTARGAGESRLAIAPG